MPQFNIGSVDLSPRKASWYRVICRMNDESRRSRVARVLEGHLPRFIEVYIAEVDYLARQYQTTWEAMYRLLDTEERSLPFTAEDITWAENQPPLVTREEELKNASKLGIELSPSSFGADLSTKLSLDAVIAIEHGFRAAFDPNQLAPKLEDLSPWAIGFRLGRRFQEEQNFQTAKKND